MNDFSEEHKERTKNFVVLYDFITKEMRDFLNENDDLTEVERAWVERMIVLFRERFDDWENEERKFLAYLYQRNGQDLFDLAAMAYLHIEYDLPISMDQARREVQEEMRKELDPIRCDHIFKSIGRKIREGMNERWRGPYRRYLGFLKIFGVEDSVLHWVMHQRQGAWSNYINIRDAGANEKSLVIDGIRSNMRGNLEEAIGSRQTPWGRALALNVPSPLAIVGASTGTAILAGLAVEVLRSGLATVSIVELIEKVAPSLGVFGFVAGVLATSVLQIARKKQLQAKLKRLGGDDEKE
jgi:hypothetical protein